MSYSDDELSRIGEEFGQRIVNDVDGIPGVTDWDNDFIHLENIICRDSEDRVIESYGEISISRDIEVDPHDGLVCEDLEGFTKYLEKKNHFLPSMALKCNILSTIYDKYKDPKSDDETRSIAHDFLGRYFERAHYHSTNTVINYNTGRIIHYPNAADVGMDIPMTDKDRKELNFKKTMIYFKDLDKNLTNHFGIQFYQNFTGLKKPEKLIEIGSEFNGFVRNDYITTDNQLHDKLGFGFIGMASNGDFHIMTANPSTPVVRGVKLR